MRTPEPLRNNPFRSRRRRSMQSKPYGEGRSDPIRSIDNMSHYSDGMGRASSRDYRPGSQEQYRPHPGFIQMPQDNYGPNDELQDMSMSDFDRTTDEFRFAAMELAGNFTEYVPQYDSGLMTEELLQELLYSLREQSGETLPPEFDMNEIVSHILATRNQVEGLGVEAQDLREDMLEIQMAVEQAKGGSFAVPHPEFSDFGTANPQEFFEQGEQMPENQLDEMQSTELGYETPMEADIDAQEALFEPSEEMGPGQPLENIIEAEHMQYEDMMPEEMYDEQMPDEMMDPFMMPGPGIGGP